MQENQSKIKIRRLKNRVSFLKENIQEAIEIWASYWRANPQRFITEYLGLEFKADFQPVLVYYMNEKPNFIYAASRGLAKSTIALLYCIYRCILYPETIIVVVAPLRSQSTGFVNTIRKFARNSPNLMKEIEKDGIKTGLNDCGVNFTNGSKIITKTFSEGARGDRATILIVDEFAQIKDKKIITGVFVPMLTAPRMPRYSALSAKEKEEYVETTRQIYLSSIRTETEWSWEYLLSYLEFMKNENDRYGVLSLPYQLGVKGGYILKENVEQVFAENPEQTEFLRAEYSAIPIRQNSDSFFSYGSFSKMRDHTEVFVAKSDKEYIEYKNKKEKWDFYIPKKEGEIRILSMDVALVQSAKNDNTSFWITRCIPNEGKYYKIVSYSETIHGENSITQAKRAKQIFYEFVCDLFAIDAVGVGRGVADICMQETYDEVRGELYPAWTSAETEDEKTGLRSLSQNALPVMYAMKTSTMDKHNRFINMRDLITSEDLHFPVTDLQAIDEYNITHKYYKITDNNLKARMLNTYVQTNMLIFEATNLETHFNNGFYNLKEKSGKRKDRVMSLAYCLDIVNQKENEYIKNNVPEDYSFLDYIKFV